MFCPSGLSAVPVYRVIISASVESAIGKRLKNATASPSGIVDGRVTSGVNKPRAISFSFTKAPASIPSSTAPPSASLPQSAPQRRLKVLKGTAAAFLNQSLLRENLIQVNLERGTDAPIHQDVPESGHGFQKAVMPTIFAIDPKHLSEWFEVVSTKVLLSGRGQHLVKQPVHGSRFGKHIHI